MANPVTRVLLVRHGATALSAEDRFSGSSDPALSPEGEAQAAAAARRLASEPIAAAYASPMKRAMTTASIITRAHNLTPRPEPGLREIDHGHWEGLRQDEVKSRYADEYARWSADPFSFAPEGAETGLALLARALPVLRSAGERHPGKTILIVSHKATIRLLACAVLGIDPRRYRDRLVCDLASISVLTFETFDRARVESWNQVVPVAG